MYVLEKDGMLYVLFTYQDDLCLVKTRDKTILKFVKKGITNLDMGSLLEVFKGYRFERIGTFVAEFCQFDPINYRKLEFGKNGIIATDEYSFILHNETLSRSIETIPNTDEKVEVFSYNYGILASPEIIDIEVKLLSVIMTFHVRPGRLEVSKLKEGYRVIPEEEYDIILNNLS